MRIGSLCSGYGGLDLAVAEVFGGEVAWFSEIEPRAAAVFAARHPGVPNLGDLRLVEWEGVEPVDILTGGFPCQPVSQAGRRRGVTDERWLFDDIADAVRGLRPRLVIFENVPGLLTANGGAAMGRVAEALADLGYVGRWGVVAAADVGAPHRRKRIFIVAAVAVRAGTWRDGGAVPRAAAQARRTRGDVPTAVDGGEALADADGGRREEQRLTQPRGLEGTRGRVADGRGAVRQQHDGADFGPYATAVERWERVLGRAAPPPASDGRLNPAFVEFMMGLPEGWVTDIESTRTHALRILGNGVVPQQAAAAIRLLVGAA